MPRKQPFPHVERDPKGGQTYYYLRRPGFPRVRLPGPYGGLEFREAYDRAMAAPVAPVPIGASRTIPGSMNALIVSFYRSARFQNLKASTATVYRGFLEKLRVEHGEKRAAGMQPKHVRAIIDAKTSPNARKRLLKILSSLMKHAVETGIRDDNPARDVEAKVPASDGFATWSEAEIAAFRAAYPIGSTPRLVFELALNTGQRRDDIARMGWRDLAGDEITIRQEKTGTEVMVPIAPDLRAALDAIPTDSAVVPLHGERGTFVMTGSGKPFTAAGLGNAFREWMRQGGFPRDCRSTGSGRPADAASPKRDARRIKSWRSWAIGRFRRRSDTLRHSPGSRRRERQRRRSPRCLARRNSEHFLPKTKSLRQSHGAFPRESLGTKIRTGDPGRIRTCDLLLRRQLLYPTELRS